MIEKKYVCDVCGTKSQPILLDNTGNVDSLDSMDHSSPPLPSGWMHIDAFVGIQLKVQNPAEEAFQSIAAQMPQLKDMARELQKAIPEHTEPLTLCLYFCDQCTNGTGFLASKIEDAKAKAKANKRLRKMRPMPSAFPDFKGVDFSELMRQAKSEDGEQNYRTPTDPSRPPSDDEE